MVDVVVGVEEGPGGGETGGWWKMGALLGGDLLEGEGDGGRGKGSRRHCIPATTWPDSQPRGGGEEEEEEEWGFEGSCQRAQSAREEEVGFAMDSA